MNVVIFDLETTGVDITKDEIIQVGAICMDSLTGKEISSFEVKILPSDKGIASLNSMRESGFINFYDPEIWGLEGVNKHFAMHRFAGWVGRFTDQKRVAKSGKSYYVAQGCGYNAAKFDYPFILNVCRFTNIFLPMDMRVWDTLQFAMLYFAMRNIEPEDYKLETIAKNMKIELLHAHDALEDARATAKITFSILNSLRKS